MCYLEREDFQVRLPLVPDLLKGHAFEVSPGRERQLRTCHFIFQRVLAIPNFPGSCSISFLTSVTAVSWMFRVSGSVMIGASCTLSPPRFPRRGFAKPN